MTKEMGDQTRCSRRNTGSHRGAAPMQNRGVNGPGRRDEKSRRKVQSPLEGGTARDNRPVNPGT